MERDEGTEMSSDARREEVREGSREAGIRVKSRREIRGVGQGRKEEREEGR